VKKLIALLLSACVLHTVHATVTLPSTIGSNMVLQQKSENKIWGWGNPLEKVVVTTSWNNKSDSVIVPPDAGWSIKVQTPAAGGPYTITIKGSNTVVLENVLIGEVWVCSGQSNMEMSYGWGMPIMTADVPTALNNNIRFFTVAKASGDAPQTDCKGQWAMCDSNTVKAFSAAAYYFGKRLNKELNIPIGLINTSWGATSAEVWTPAEIVEGDYTLKQAAARLGVNPYCPIKPGCVYNTMLNPLLNTSIAGAIWYQGETNTGTAGSYAKLFTAMITSWRAAWGKDFPFYYVQIAPFTYGNNFNGIHAREQQTQAMQLKNTGMVVITDITGDTTDIHPKNKRDVGYRLAGWALAETYNKAGAPYKSATYKSMEVKDANAIISFNNADGGLTSSGAVTQVYVAGTDRVFYPAQAEIKNDRLIVHSTKVSQPVAVRYAFSNTAIGNLAGPGGLPVNAFRTDDWSLAGPAY